MLDQHLFLPVTILMPCILLKQVKLSRVIFVEQNKFSGHFDRESVVESVPRCLVELVSMIEHGPDIKSQIEIGIAKSDVAIAQFCSSTVTNNDQKNKKVNTRDIQVTANHLLLFI